MYKVKKVGVWSCGKLSAVISFLFGIIVFFLFLITILPIALLANSSFMGGSLTYSSIIFPALIISLSYPFILAIQGFIMGVLGAFVYNLASSWVGPLEVEIENVNLETVPNPRNTD